MFGPIVRWEPKSYSSGRVFIEAALGLTSTKYAWTYGFDVGGGFEWDIPDARASRSGRTCATAP